MNDFSQLLSQGAAHAWFFLPTAVALGALHGLEPGHSKTMMAAFIVAVRGTIGQAVLLGLSAAFSHSLVIWALAAVALKFGSQWNAESTEPYFQMGSAAVIAGLALWMLWRTRREAKEEEAHEHGHSHGEVMQIDTGHGVVELTVFETGVPPVFRLHFLNHGKPMSPPAAGTVKIETLRPDGGRQGFDFVSKGDFLESTTDIPEPHEFEATLSLGHGDHSHSYAVSFSEGGHAHGEVGGEYQDAHERAHSQEIERRFANRQVTTGQIVVFGLTGGLLPCPAAFSILIICLQLKQFTLGFAMVLAFSFGLALTLVASGTLAAWSVRHAEKRWGGLGKLTRKLPYLSVAFLLIVATYIGWQGWSGLRR